MLSRRAALQGGTATVAAIAGAGAVAAGIAVASSDTDPVVTLSKEFKSLTAAYFIHHPNPNGADGKAVWGQAMIIRDQIIDTRPTTSEGLARKLLVYSDWWMMGYRREEFLSNIVADACCLANTPRPKAYFPAESRELKSRRPSFERLAGRAEI